MKIGLPKEIKDNEYRVGLTPAGVQALCDAGHQLISAELRHRITPERQPVSARRDTRYL